MAQDEGLTRGWPTTDDSFGNCAPKTEVKEMGEAAVLREGSSVLFAWKLLKRLAPQVGLEPTTLRLTATMARS